MQKIFISVLILFLSACTQVETDGSVLPRVSLNIGHGSVEESQNYVMTSESELIFIDNKVKDIENHLSEYEIREEITFGYSAEGSEIKAYTNNDVIKKISAEHFGETGKATQDFYYDENVVFFVIYQNYSYSIPLPEEGTPGVISSTSVEKFYFNGGRLIKRVLNRYDLSEKQSERNPEEVLGMAKTFFNKMVSL